MCRIIISRSFKRTTILRCTGQTKPEIIGLYQLVSTTRRLQRVRLDTPTEATGRIALYQIGIDSIRELVIGRKLNAIQRLVKIRIIFTPNKIGDTRTCHQIAFVGTINELFCLYMYQRILRWIFRTLQSDRLNGTILHICFGDSILIQHIEAPVFHKTIHGFRSHTRWECPLFEFIVMLANPSIKQTSQPRHCIFIANIGHTQPSSCHASQIFTRFDEQDRFTHLLSRIGGYDPSRRATIDANIDLAYLTGRILCRVTSDQHTGPNQHYPFTTLFHIMLHLLNL